MNRPFDNQSQEKIRLETEAIMIILTRASLKQWNIIGSEATDYEISKIPDLNRKDKVLTLTQLFHEKILFNDKILLRSKDIEKIGIKPLDSIHIACAENYPVNIFLTTDKDIIKKYNQNSTFFQIKIQNPIKFLLEVL